jgi:hypothetical protein
VYVPVIEYTLLPTHEVVVLTKKGTLIYYLSLVLHCCPQGSVGVSRVVVYTDGLSSSVNNNLTRAMLILPTLLSISFFSYDSPPVYLL